MGESTDTRRLWCPTCVGDATPKPSVDEPVESCDTCGDVLLDLATPDGVASLKYVLAARRYKRRNIVAAYVGGIATVPFIVIVALLDSTLLLVLMYPILVGLSFLIAELSVSRQVRKLERRLLAGEPDFVGYGPGSAGRSGPI